LDEGQAEDCWGVNGGKGVGYDWDIEMGKD